MTTDRDQEERCCWLSDGTRWFYPFTFSCSTSLLAVPLSAHLGAGAIRHVNPPDFSVDSLGILVWKQEGWGPLSDSNDELCSRANQSVA